MTLLDAREWLEGIATRDVTLETRVRATASTLADDWGNTAHADTPTLMEALNLVGLDELHTRTMIVMADEDTILDNDYTLVVVDVMDTTLGADGMAAYSETLVILAGVGYGILALKDVDVYVLTGDFSDIGSYCA